MSNERLRNGLVLALDRAADGIADFMFTVRPSSDVDIAIWHPLADMEETLDLAVLKHTLLALASADDDSAAPGASLRLALLGKHDVTNLELQWSDGQGTQRCWLISTRHDERTVTGLVRDVSLARDVADTVAQGLLVSPQQHARRRMANASVAAAIRQQAHVISSICELLCDTPETTPRATDCSRAVLASDARSAISQLITTADLLRDYTDAEHGCLKLEPQRWPVPDIIARAMPGMKRLLERHGVHLVSQQPPRGAALYADLQRVSMLVQLVACNTLRAMTPDRTAEFACSVPPCGGVAFTWTYEGASCNETSFQATAPCFDTARLSCHDLMHPAISGGLMNALLVAHNGSLKSAPTPDGFQAITLHLHDIAAE